MFGKVLHNVYQVRVGQHLYPATIGRKYIFPPADISMQYFEQRKAIVNTCQLRDEHFDSAFEESAIKLLSEHDESEASTHTSLEVAEKPKSSPPGMSRPIAEKFTNLTARAQATRKPKTTNWYLHHVPSSIQRNTKNQNDRTRNISLLNDFANRSYINKEMRPLRTSQVRKPNPMKRPITVPFSKESKFSKYTKPNIGSLNTKPYLNFNLHTQCNKDENLTIGEYAEYLRKRKLGSKLKLFPDGFSTKSSVRNFKDSSSHKLKEQELNENNAKQGKVEITFSGVKQPDSVRPSTPSKAHNCKLLHFNTHALKTQESKIQNDRSGEKLNREEDEPFAKILRGIESPVASRLSKTTNGKGSTKTSSAQSHTQTKPKKSSNNDDSRPSSKQKSGNGAYLERPVSRAKSVVQTKTSSCLARRPQTPLEKKLMSSTTAQHAAGRQKSTLYELQNKLRKEKRESKKQKYFPPLGASHSFGRPLAIARPATSPGRLREPTKKGTEQLKAKRKLDDSYARTVLDEMKIKRPKTLAGRESEKCASTYSRTERFRHSRPRLTKPKMDDGFDMRRDTFRHDDRKYHSDEAEIQRLKRQMFVNSITNGLKPKTVPNLKAAKSLDVTGSVEEMREAQHSTEREIPITHMMDISRKEPSSQVLVDTKKEAVAEATEVSEEKRGVQQEAREQRDVESVMEVDTRKRCMSSNVSKNQEAVKDEEEENVKPKKRSRTPSPRDEVGTTETLSKPSSEHKIARTTTSLDQRIAETFEAMRLAQEGVNKTEPSKEGIEKGRQLFKTRYKNLYSLPNEKEVYERKSRIRQMSQGDVQVSKDLEAEMKYYNKKNFLDSRLNDWLKDVRNTEGRERRKHLFMRERTKPLDFGKNLEASSKPSEKRREENLNRVKATDDYAQQSNSYKRKRKEPSDNRPTSRSQKSKIGRYSEEIPVIKTDERSKLVDLVLQRRSSKFTSPERRKSKNRRKNDHHGSSQTSQDSMDRKSHSQQAIKSVAPDLHELIEKRKVKSSVVIGEKKLKDKKKTSYSFHNLGRKLPDRFTKKFLASRSIRSKSELDLKGRSVFEQWRARLRKLKNSFFGGKE